MKLFLITFLFTSSLFAQDLGKGKEEVLEIILGIDKIIKLDFSPSTKIQVGNSSILNYQIIPQKREITLKGIKPGKTSLNIRNLVGDIKKRMLIKVKVNDQSQTVQKLRAFLGDIEGLEIGIKEGEVFVGGQIFVPSDIGKIFIVLSDYPEVKKFIELAPQTQQIIANQMQVEVHKSGFKDVTTRVLNGTFILEGTVHSQAEKVRVQDIATLLLPDRLENLARQVQAVKTNRRKPIISNHINVNTKKKKDKPSKMVKITTQFVELSKSYQDVFGFSWSPLLNAEGGSIRIGKGPQRAGQSGGELTTASEGTFSAIISNLFPKLSSARGAGYARVIQSGVIIVKDKESAKISKSENRTSTVGTENPVTLKVNATFDISTTPVIKQGEKIDMDVHVKVSSFVGSQSTTLVNELRTKLIIKSKQSAVIGGVVSKSSATEYDKHHPDANKREVNYLFSFVRSKSYLQDKSQFVVFMTPEIIDDASVGTNAIKRKFRRRSR